MANPTNPKIDPNLTWKKVEERLKSETNPKIRNNLEQVLKHMKAEAVADIDGLLETISPEGTMYRFFGSPDEDTSECHDHADVRAFYENFVASGATKLQLDVDRLVADEDCVITEGIMRMAYPGATLQAMGHEVDDPAAFYLYETRMCVIWPAGADGRMTGEETYTGRDGFEGIADRKLTADDLGELDLAS